jgi:hypothetical protein
MQEPSNDIKQHQTQGWPVGSATARQVLLARVGLAAGVMAWPAATVSLSRVEAGALASLRHPAATPDDVLVALAAGVGLAALAWLALTVIAGLVTLAPGHERRARVGELRVVERWAGRCTPSAVRRCLSLAVGVALLAAPSAASAASRAPVAAITAVAGVTPDADVSQPAPLDPGWGLERSSDPPRLDPSWGDAARRRAAAHDDEVVVRRGDTLWDVAARHLGAAATDAEIARAWPQWYAANRGLIGPDPDRLLPGQRLLAPMRNGASS